MNYLVEKDRKFIIDTLVNGMPSFLFLLSLQFGGSDPLSVSISISVSISPNPSSALAGRQAGSGRCVLLWNDGASQQTLSTPPMLTLQPTAPVPPLICTYP